MLSTKEAVFHLKFIPTRWYSEEKDNIQEPFLTADKYMQEGQQFVYNNDESGLGLCLFEQVNNEFRNEYHCYKSADYYSVTYVIMIIAKLWHDRFFSKCGMINFSIFNHQFCHINHQCNIIYLVDSETR